MNFSFIIPAHNNPELLADLVTKINQVATESRSSYEVIVVDDASGEETKSRIRSLSSQGLISKTVTFPENRGVSAARNEGLRATGCSKWVVFFDDDDRIDDDFSNALKFVENNKSAELVVTGYVKSELDDQVIQFWPSAGKVSAQAVSDYLQRYCLFPSKHYAFVHVWSKFYSTQLLKNNNILFTEGMPLHEDIEFNLKFLSLKPSVYYCSAYFYYHNISTNSASFRHPWDVKSVLSITLVMRRVERVLRQNGISHEVASLLSRHMLWHYLMVNIVRAGARVKSIGEYILFSKAWSVELSKPCYIKSIRRYNARLAGGSVLIPLLIQTRRMQMALLVAVLRGKMRYKRLS